MTHHPSTSPGRRHDGPRRNVTVQRPAELAILIERPDAGVDTSALGERVAAELSRQGAAFVRVVVEAVLAIPRAALGKAPLVRREL